MHVVHVRISTSGSRWQGTGSLRQLQPSEGSMYTANPSVDVRTCVCAFVCLCCVLCVVPDPLGRLIRRRLVHASNVIFAFVCLFVHNSLGSNTVNSLKFKTESRQLVTAGKGFPACTRPSVHQAKSSPGRLPLVLVVLLVVGERKTSPGSGESFPLGAQAWWPAGASSTFQHDRPEPCPELQLLFLPPACGETLSCAAL